MNFQEKLDSFFFFFIRWESEEALFSWKRKLFFESFARSSGDVIAEESNVLSNL